MPIITLIIRFWTILSFQHNPARLVSPPGIAKRHPENLVVFTDRNLYAVNEKILFSALLQSGTDPTHGLGSSVLYAELVNVKGEAVAQGKYLIREHRSSGHLSIPSTILSGIYHLRCYTRWMKNFGPRHFAYIPIRVVNPFSTDVEVLNPEPEKSELAPAQKGTRGVSITPTRKSYQPGEMIEMELSLMKGTIFDLQHGCVTVVPSGAIDTSVFLFRMESRPDNPAPFGFDFLPERNGTSISGTVHEQRNGKPASDTRIHFSILGDDPDYFVTNSDQDGRFLISTPLRYGNLEMFVVPEFRPDIPLEVRIDNDFTSDSLPFQPGAFNLQQDEQLIASRLSLQMQLQRAYLVESGSDSAILTKRMASVPFYGIPEISVEIGDFINLPSLEEVIQNLIPKTFVVRRGGKVTFMIKSENPMISLFKPLVLIDHIPVFDMDVILAIPPSKIRRVEVIPEVYVRGEVKYGGIISFTSQKGDLAGITLPEGSYFFDYSSFQTSWISQRARYSGSGMIPDTRNTLFWMDHLELLKDRSTKVTFQGASVPGTYYIIFRGILSDGSIVHGMNGFYVE